MNYFQQPKTTGTWCEYDSVLWRKNMASPDDPATHYPHGIAVINYSMSTYFRGWDGSIFNGSIGGRWPSLPKFLRVWQSWTPFLFSNQFHSDVLETQHTVWIFTKLTSRTFHNAPIASFQNHFGDLWFFKSYSRTNGPGIIWNLVGCSNLVFNPSFWGDDRHHRL